MIPALKVAMVHNKYESIPDWVADQLASNRITLVHHQCTNDNDVIALAHDSHVAFDLAGSSVITAECLLRLS